MVPDPQVRPDPARVRVPAHERGHRRAGHLPEDVLQGVPLPLHRGRRLRAVAPPGVEQPQVWRWSPHSLRVEVSPASFFQPAQTWTPQGSLSNALVAYRLFVLGFHTE